MIQLHFHGTVGIHSGGNVRIAIDHHGVAQLFLAGVIRIAFEGNAVIGHSVVRRFPVIDFLVRLVRKTYGIGGSHSAGNVRFLLRRDGHASSFFHCRLISAHRIGCDMGTAVFFRGYMGIGSCRHRRSFGVDGVGSAVFIGCPFFNGCDVCSGKIGLTGFLYISDVGHIGQGIPAACHIGNHIAAIIEPAVR